MIVMANGIKNHKKIEVCLFVAICIQVLWLIKQSYRFEDYANSIKQIQ